ncbi:MAG: argininosuccinate lyase [Promethearchaeota archaeon]
MGKLWQKKETSLDKDIELFEVGDDYLLDMHLAPFDLYGSSAHARMLNKIGILSQSELDLIINGLKDIMKSIDEDTFQINITDEDVHTKVENILTEQIGDVGKKLHAARSRNDQVLVDLRLYAKHEIIKTIIKLLDLSTILNDFAKKYEFIPMPGYTHMQLAMPSSVGMWASSFVENIIEELRIIESAFVLNNMNPLGSGAAYGVFLDIDRDYTTGLLGFDRTQKNSLYCSNSRGKVEAHVLNSLSGFGLILNRIATDLLFFTTKEFEFFKTSDTIKTGSSIMPQKKNLDVMELIRGKTHILLGYESQIKNIIANIPSGYNRDYQETKRLLINGFSLLQQMVKITKLVFLNLEPIEENLINAHSPEIYAADAAYRLVKKGVPFRKAYKEIGNNLDKLKSEDPVKNIKSKTHVGSTGNLQLSKYDNEIQQNMQKWTKIKNEYRNKLEKLI